MTSMNKVKNLLSAAFAFNNNGGSERNDYYSNSSLSRQRRAPYGVNSRYGPVYQQPYRHDSGSLSQNPRASMDYSALSQQQSYVPASNTSLNRSGSRKAVNFVLPAEEIPGAAIQEDFEHQVDDASSTDETLPIPDGTATPTTRAVAPTTQPSSNTVPTIQAIKMEDSVVGVQQPPISNQPTNVSAPRLPQRQAMPRSISLPNKYESNSATLQRQVSSPPLPPPPNTQQTRPPLYQTQSQQPQQPLSASSLRAYGTGLMERVDVSASVAGSPLDPRVNDSHQKRPFSLQQYQIFTQAFSSYRRQLQAFSAATETLVRSLEDLSAHVPHTITPILDASEPPSKPASSPAPSDEKQAQWIQNLDFLIDTSQMIANTHETWAVTIEREVEQPLVNSVQEVMTRSSVLKQQNRERIAYLMQKLTAEEDYAYRMYKRKSRDMTSMQQSLSTRMKCVEEIQFRETQNMQMNDILAQNQLNQTLAILSRSVPAMMNTYETLLEGFSKIGAGLASQSGSKGTSDTYLEEKVARVSSISLTKSPVVINKDNEHDQENLVSPPPSVKHFAEAKHLQQKPAIQNPVSVSKNGDGISLGKKGTRNAGVVEGEKEVSVESAEASLKGRPDENSTVSSEEVPLQPSA